MRNKQFYSHEICRPARTRYMQSPHALEPWEYRMSWWLIVLAAGGWSVIIYLIYRG